MNTKMKKPKKSSREHNEIQYSIVVPIYNDGYLASAFCTEIERVFVEYTGKRQISQFLEVIFVNDGSSNDSISILNRISEQYDFVTILDLSRNFGQHIAIACGLQEASGEIVFRLNVDMQDRPDEMPRFIELIRNEDLDLVIGQYAVRESPWVNRLTAKLYFQTFKFLTGFPSPQNTSPLRAMSRRFVDAYNLLTERSRFPQGLDQWLGFNQRYVPITHYMREDRRSSYNFWSRLRLGLEGILYFSNRPLTLIACLGFFLSFLGLLTAAYFVVLRLFWADLLPGFATTIVVALTAFGLQLGCIGVVGLYVARIFKETQNRPLYLVKSRYRGTREPARRHPNEYEA